MRRRGWAVALFVMVGTTPFRWPVADAAPIVSITEVAARLDGSAVAGAPGALATTAIRQAPPGTLRYSDAIVVQAADGVAKARGESSQTDAIETGCGSRLLRVTTRARSGASAEAVQSLDARVGLGRAGVGYRVTFEVSQPAVYKLNGTLGAAAGDERYASPQANVRFDGTSYRADNATPGLGLQASGVLKAGTHWFELSAAADASRDDDHPGLTASSAAWDFTLDVSRASSVATTADPATGCAL